MFKAESDMTSSVEQWMKSLGLTTRLEFISPWGICDIVGLSFNKQNVAKRLAYGQRSPISSITRATLLLRIPDVETHTHVTMDELVEDCSPVLSREVVEAETELLIKQGFVIAQSKDCLQKRNGWMPLQNRLIAVELKLRRVGDALLQARNNLGFADESYVALPEEIAIRIEKNSTRLNDFRKNGIGLLAVTPTSCRPILLTEPQLAVDYSAVKLYCVEKFWRPHLRGN